MSTWITVKLFGYRLIEAAGEIFPQRRKVRFFGADVVDNVDEGSTDVTVTGLGTIEEVHGDLPITVDNTDPANPVVAINPATTANRGTLSAADKLKLDGLGAGAQVVEVTAALPIVITPSPDDAHPEVWINPATGTDSGSMSATDKAKSDARLGVAVGTPASSGAFRLAVDEAVRVWSTIAGANLDVLKSTAADLLQLGADTVNAGIELRTKTGGLVKVLVGGVEALRVGAASVLFPQGVANPSIGQVAAAGAGTTMSLRAQGGTTGGTLTIGGGAPTTGGTDTPGGTDIDLGQQKTATNRSGSLRLMSNGAVVGELSSYFLGLSFTGAGGGELFMTAALTRLNGTTTEIQGSTVVRVAAPTVVWQTYVGAVTRRTDTIGSIWVTNYASTVTEILDVHASPTSDVPCATRYIATQPAFATATGDNRIPGKLYFELGQPSNGGLVYAPMTFAWGDALTSPHRSAHGTTSGAVTETIYTEQMEDETTAIVIVHVIARVASTGASAGFTRRAVVDRTGGGGATLVGGSDETIGTDRKHASLAAADVHIVIDGDLWAIEVTGVALDIDWGAPEFTVRTFNPSAL